MKIIRARTIHRFAQKNAHKSPGSIDIMNNLCYNANNNERYLNAFLMKDNKRSKDYEQL